LPDLLGIVFQEGLGGHPLWLVGRKGIAIELRECFTYQQRQPASYEPAAFLFYGAAIGDRKQMTREYIRTLRGDLGQEFLHFDVGEDDVGLPLKGFVVTPFETVAFLRRTDEGSGFYQEVLHLNKR